MNGTAELRMNNWTAQVSEVRVSYSQAMPEEDATLTALTRRYRGRGFERAAKEHEQDMDAMKEEAQAVSPAHYRWDELCANGRGDRFRGATYLGRRVMDVDDFAAYFTECRAQRRAAGEQEIAEQNAVVPARTREESRMARMMGTSLVASAPKQDKGSASDRLIAFAREWLRPDDPSLRRSGKHERIPVTVISVLVVIAVSLMLIVSSSVMVANAKRDVANLGDEVAALEKQAQLTTDKLESHVDYLEIYRTATEELGMIPATYVDSLYVDATNGNAIEVVEAEEDAAPGLATLLSAIGVDLAS